MNDLTDGIENIKNIVETPCANDTGMEKNIELEKLIKTMRKKPSKYEISEEKFWYDEYISAQMLKAHLDPEFEAASRRHDFIKKSVTWISQLASNSQDKTLLDLGCGPGIYTDGFYDMGFSVTGVDYSKRSIDFAKQSAHDRGKDITYIYENYLNLDYTEKFDVIVLIYCDFGVLSSEDRSNLLKRIYKALKPGGLFVVDVFTQKQYSDFKETNTVEYKQNGFWSAEPYVCIKCDYEYPADVFLEQYHVMTQNQYRCYNIWNTVFDENTLLKCFRDAGFFDVEFYGDVCGSDFEKNSKTICAVGRK